MINLTDQQNLNDENKKLLCCIGPGLGVLSEHNQTSQAATAFRDALCAQIGAWGRKFDLIANEQSPPLNPAAFANYTQSLATWFDLAKQGQAGDGAYSTWTLIVTGFTTDHLS